jgi:hypothetical protein
MKLAALALLAGCAATRAVIDDVSHSTDPDCIAALAHVVQCDARFGDRRALCSRGEVSSCGPYINVEQSNCLAAARCEQVRDAIDRADWLCGVKAR